MNAVLLSPVSFDPSAVETVIDDCAGLGLTRNICSVGVTVPVAWIFKACEGSILIFWQSSFTFNFCNLRQPSLYTLIAGVSNETEDTFRSTLNCLNGGSALFIQ